MPGAKRSAKSVSYTERVGDDDDDFISKNDKSKQTRATTDKQLKETKTSNRQPPRKRNEKVSKAEQEELDLVLKLSKETEVSIEIPIVNRDVESTTSQSTESSHTSKTTEKESNEQDENSLPKSKRMKREEEEEEEEDDDVAESESSIDEVGEEVEETDEEEPTPEKKPVRKSKETTKTSEVPTIKSIDLNSIRSTTRVQEKSSVTSTDISKKKSNTPVGFPTSKIIIPSTQPSRVGLSRNSAAIKPLHRNLNQRIVHE